MQHSANIKSIIFLVLFANTSYCQNIFDSINATYYNGGLDPIIYPPTRFERYIKSETQKNFDSSSKVVLMTLAHASVPYFDTAYDAIIENKYILLSYKGGNCWIGTAYLELLRGNKSSFLKSSPKNLPEIVELIALRDKWDSLKYDWYLPFVSKIQLHGITGYFQNQASHCQDIVFYAIDKTNAVFKSISKCDSDKEWKFLSEVIKNENYEYNFSQPTFAAMIYLLTLYDSPTAFSGYKVQ